MDELLNKQIEKEFVEASETFKRSCKRPTVLICGYTGTGKTTLIKKICGDELVPDNAVSDCAPGTQDFIEYSNEMIRFWDSQGLEPNNQEDDYITRTKVFVKSIQKTQTVDDHIHIVWYCIQGSGARVTDTDKRLIKEIFMENNVLVLLTKNDATRENQRLGMIKELISAGVKENCIIPVSDEDVDSLKKVVSRTYEMLPSAYRQAFMTSQKVNIDEKTSVARGIIHASASAAAAAGAIPIPVSDAPILVSIQVAMIAGLSALYGFSKESILTVFGPGLAAAIGTLTASSLVKLIPGLGSIIQAGVAASLTEALGWTVQAYLRDAAIARSKGMNPPEFKHDLSKISLMISKLIGKNNKDNA